MNLTFPQYYKPVLLSMFSLENSRLYSLAFTDGAGVQVEIYRVYFNIASVLHLSLTKRLIC